jgi:hypothetical protein
MALAKDFAARIVEIHTPRYEISLILKIAASATSQLRLIDRVSASCTVCVRTILGVGFVYG